MSFNPLIIGSVNIISPIRSTLAMQIFIQLTFYKLKQFTILIKENLKLTLLELISKKI